MPSPYEHVQRGSRVRRQQSSPSRRRPVSAASGAPSSSSAHSWYPAIEHSWHRSLWDATERLARGEISAFSAAQEGFVAAAEAAPRGRQQQQLSVADIRGVVAERRSGQRYRPRQEGAGARSDDGDGDVRPSSATGPRVSRQRQRQQQQQQQQQSGKVADADAENLLQAAQTLSGMRGLEVRLVLLRPQPSHALLLPRGAINRCRGRR
jgi:hypothetical protein